MWVWGFFLFGYDLSSHLHLWICEGAADCLHLGSSFPLLSVITLLMPFADTDGVGQTQARAVGGHCPASDWKVTGT